MKNPKDINILIACEESQAVCSEFRKRGFNAFSCDLLECSGEFPEYHIVGDVRNVLTKKGFHRMHWFVTQDNHTHCVDKWDLVIAHPPCTYLAVCGNRWFKVNPERESLREEAFDFFMSFTRLNVGYVAIENPIGCVSSRYRKPDQIIQPWQFGDSFSKKTCLWLKGLPLLEPTDIVDPGEMVTFESGRKMPKWYSDACKLPPEERARIRSKTFPGIAKAMAKQWGDYLIGALSCKISHCDK